MNFIQSYCKYKYASKCIFYEKSRNIFLLMLFALLILSSCSSIFAIGSAALITTTWNDSRSIGTQLDDSILKAHIYYTLHQNKQFKQITRVTSTVYQGNVLLTGQAPSLYWIQEATRQVKKIQGVKNIYNAIRQNQSISFQDIIIDILISNQIRFNLFTQKNTNISKIKVITENKEVFLLGTVYPEEGFHAEKIAKIANGVKNVFTVFIYI